MKVRTLRLDDDGYPDRVTVDMTADEAAYIARITGRMTGQMMEATFGTDVPWKGINSGVYYALVDGVFNRYWDGGVADYRPTERGEAR